MKYHLLKLKIKNFSFSYYRPSPNLKQVMMCCGIQNAPLDIWNKTLIKYNNTEDKDDKEKIMRALSCSANETVLEHYLTESLLNPNAIINDTMKILENIRDNSVVGVNVTLYLIKKWTPAIILKLAKELVTVFIFFVITNILVLN